MTGDIFRQWLHQVNNRMIYQQRKILMFVDNCSAHPDVQLSRVKLVFLPPKTTSHLHPCDGGIIQAVQLNYRRRFLRHLLLRMNDTASASDLAKEVTVLDAIMWLKLAWNGVSDITTQKCFALCGFNVSIPNPEPEETDTTDESDFQTVLNGVKWTDYIDADGRIHTSNTADTNWEEDLISTARGEVPPASDSDSEDEPMPAAQYRSTLTHTHTPAYTTESNLQSVI